ncbi:MAG TPA: adenosine nucleotide hydrolase, partial [Syntrophomonadaceae bacterium]|nr:adenosine nucleotide hydrolase [Syntrophomonadaceae bacterium]
YLGRVLDKQLMLKLAADGIDVAGENGEFHTIVTNGPLFRFPVNLKINGFKPVGQHCFVEFD